MLKIGVIGVGSMGKNHARVCSELEDVDLVGVVDADRSTAKRIAKIFDTEPFFDYKEIIPKIDAAIVATPTSTHYKIAMGLLDEGKHVLVEKPICSSVKEAEELVKKAERKDLVLAVGHIERHNPAVRFVRDMANRKEFGEIISLSSKRVSNLPTRIRDVGVILDFGVHDIDVMRFLVGDIESVYARAGRFNKDIKYEDHANIVLNFKNGVTGVLEVNWLTPMKVRKLFLTCSKNFVEVDYMRQLVIISSSTFREMDEINLYNVPIQYNIHQITLERKEPLKNEITDFVEAIMRSREPLATGVDGLMALKVAKAAEKSFKTGDVIRL
ncbi:MAG: hypothetical protein DRN00_01040 [Thermoplasmata archaeon]|nr:MAG: hypothetical protein DRN00_01040 [Thermoplasmata archaeon]